MRIIGALLLSLLLFVFLVSLVGDPDGLSGRGQDQNQAERPKFYAVQVISEKGVLNAKDALGAPDGHYTEILPGGQLVLLMEKELYVFPVGGQDWVGLAYSGAIVAKGETPAALEGWIPIRDLRGDKRHDWVSIGMGSPPNPGWPGWPEGTVRTHKIRITNTGTESLFVDAIIGWQTDY